METKVEKATREVNSIKFEISLWEAVKPGKDKNGKRGLGNSEYFDDPLFPEIKVSGYNELNGCDEEFTIGCYSLESGVSKSEYREQYEMTGETPAFRYPQDVLDAVRAHILNLRPRLDAAKEDLKAKKRMEKKLQKEKILKEKNMDYNMTVRQETEWKKLYTPSQVLRYEGSTLKDKPFGVGTTYYSSGMIYQEGIFEVKGLVCGREYYPSGRLRFEGLYEINHGYGPNYPKYGKCYDEAGEMYYEGELSVTKSGLGYPKVEKPEEYGAIVGEARPDIEYLMWEDVKGSVEE